jgi:CelD/BcsL family acetyltransferase involved in cellulose biosynthesis
MIMSTELLEKATPPSTTTSGPGRGPYRVQVIRSLTEFVVLQRQWDDFLKRAGVENLCMTHGWLRIWMSHFPPRKMAIMVVLDANQEWVGLAPLQIKPSRNGLTHRILHAVEWIGTNPTVFDWMQFAVHPNADEQAVITAIGQALQKERWDLLDLQFCLNRTQLEWLTDSLPTGNRQAVREGGVIPYVSLPATVEEYESQRRKKTRLEVNRHKNRFAKEFGAPPTLTFLPASEASDAILTRFFAGHTKYWADRGEKSDFLRYPALFEFYKDMLAYSHFECQPDEPRLLLSIMTVSDHQLSFHLGFWQGKTYLSHITHYNQGFKGYSPGTIHMDNLIFSTLEMGGNEFEFGRGDEPYKTQWTKAKKPLWQLRIFRNPLAAAIWQVDNLLKKCLRKGSE